MNIIPAKNLLSNLRLFFWLICIFVSLMSTV